MTFLNGMLSETDTDKLKNELMEVYNFVEIVEAFTTDQRTSNKIRLFLEEKGLWKSQPIN